jgi:hypothetical protein
MFRHGSSIVYPRQQRILSCTSGVEREEEEDMGALIQDPDESGRQRGFRRNATMSMLFLVKGEQINLFSRPKSWVLRDGHTVHNN